MGMELLNQKNSESHLKHWDAPSKTLKLMQSLENMIRIAMENLIMKNSLLSLHRKVVEIIQMLTQYLVSQENHLVKFLIR